MKKFTLINNETGVRNEYSKMAWEISWVLVFVSGVVTGASLFGIITGISLP